MKLFVWLTLAFVAGAAGSWLLLQAPADGESADQPAPAAAGQDERRVIYYRHPHSPRITSDKPMKDEMGMDYIPIYADADEAGGSDLRIAPEVVQNLGVRTATAKTATVTPTIEAFAVAAYDERLLAHVHVRAEGWVERLAVRSLGERVRRDDLLFEWYSPQLVNAQEEYLRAAGIGRPGVRQVALDRLSALGLAATTIETLTASGRPLQTIPVYAPADGVVTQIGVRDGMYITPAVDLLTLADLSSAWVYVDLFEHQAPLVTVGQPATLTLASYPNEPLQGSVEFLEPQLDPQTRTVRARLRFDNPDERIKPNMYGRAQIMLSPRQDVLLIPRQALIRSGDEQRVILAREGGRFAVAFVESGPEFGDEVEIISGLSDGDTVVVSAQFLLDSESSLRAAFTRMEPLAEEGHEAQEEQGAAGVLAVWSSGTYHGPGTKEGTISLSHEPITEFGWPAMKMDLPLAPDVSVGELAPDTAISFQLERLDDITYRILAVQPQPGGEQQ
ncbi:MAG: efflux RND transporter periplasmic adaptor subunit [Desulfobulbaceae bacterium]|nr:efflux RND transporter periplasmic adaptor subunit [Desulfobulbaceae bacterium]